MAKTVAAQIRQVLREDMKRISLFTNKYKNFRTVKCYAPHDRFAPVSEYRVSLALAKIERIYAENNIPFKMKTTKAPNTYAGLPGMIFYLPL